MKIKFKDNSYRIIVSIAIVLLLMSASGCQKSNDMPPKMEGPEPEPHKGIFVSENAVFTFDGTDTVFVEFDEEYLKALDNPPNNAYYSYVFTWYSFGDYRYDGATNLRLYHEESDTGLNFLTQGNTTAERIEISSPVPGDENIVFNLNFTIGVFFNLSGST